MEKKEVDINNITTIAGLTVIPVVHVSLNYWLCNSSASFFSVKEPVAVIVVSPAVKRAFRLTGEEVSIDQIVEEASELKEILMNYPTGNYTDNSNLTDGPITGGMSQQ